MCRESGRLAGLEGRNEPFVLRGSLARTTGVHAVAADDDEVGWDDWEFRVARHDTGINLDGTPKNRKRVWEQDREGRGTGKEL